MLKSYMHDLYINAHDLNQSNTIALLPSKPGARLLDLGCADGTTTEALVRGMDRPEVHGMEIFPATAALARARGIQVAEGDLSEKWPYPDAHFDVVHSSFVIEHMTGIDHFAEETFRVLKPGGVAIHSTENGSSWHNIVAAIMGWQTFSSSCCSVRTKGLGNPLAQQRGAGKSDPGQIHRVIFNYLGYKEFFEVHGFRDIEIAGAGYYPLPASVGRLDPRHAHFLALKAVKP